MTHVATFGGYASLFNTPDRNGDIVSPGAFARAIKPHKLKDVKLLYQHRPEQPIGRWSKLEEDSRGLWAEGEIILSSAAGRECYSLLKGRALDGLSIGFKMMRAEKFHRNRRITEADLWEVSIVTFPMAPGARIAFVDEPEPQSSPPPTFSEYLAGATLADALRGAAFLLSA
ncbi:MAG: HK97 family phage prohead protease [Parvularculaceae bacterium]